MPLDITEEEFIELMGKCGMIMKDPKTQKYKVKLYMDSNGYLKGDGLCDYIKVSIFILSLFNYQISYDACYETLVYTYVQIPLTANMTLYCNHQ